MKLADDQRKYLASKILKNVQFGFKYNAMKAKRPKRRKSVPFTVDSTNVTLEQWGDTMSVKDTAAPKTAHFVKYNRMDIPVTPLERCPDKVSRAALDAQYTRAEDAIRANGYMEAQLKESQLELSKARVLIERMARRLLDNGDL